MAIKEQDKKKIVQHFSRYPSDYLRNEAYSLLARLNRVKPFSLTMPMVKGASVSGRALQQISDLLENSKQELRNNTYKFIETIQSSTGAPVNEQVLQGAYTILKLRFNSILDQLDIYADVLSQRSEHETGVWLSGLDVLAEDGLKTLKQLATLPDLMVYLDRGHGAAIRRARTRLPGGDINPVAVIQVPRERMVGSGIASSLIHEVGHQAAAILNLVPGLKKEILQMGREQGGNIAWTYFERWISEIICDAWATGHLGVTATLGLMSVVSLPKYFQFRLDLNDPHPAPYMRVYLSYAFGKRLFPHAQWDKLWHMWKSFYPKEGLQNEKINALNELEKETEKFVTLVLNFSTPEMKGLKLWQLFPAKQRQPEELRRLYKLWASKSISLQSMSPTLVFAMLGQAKADLAIDAITENKTLTKQLQQWAFHRN
jgi:hypothetical protein